MEEFQQILENSKVTEERIKDGLLHPLLQKKLKPREVFDEIIETTSSYFQNGSAVRMIGLAGLRGTGKTTLLWQTADFIYKNYTTNIYFFHLAYLQKYDIGIREIQDGIEKYLADGKLWAYKQKIVLLFDEIHEDPNWAKDLKILYDLFPIVFGVATGSSALLLQSTADLVTRMHIQHILPLNFREYIGFTHSETVKIPSLRNDLEKVLLHSENAKSLFNDLQSIRPNLDKFINKIDNTEERIYDYIVYHNIIRFLLIESKFQITDHIKDLVRRVIYEDIPKLSNENIIPKNADKILSRLAASDEINIQSLSQSIGISQDKINQNLDILVKAELLNVLYPYGGIDSKINKTQKYFFMSPSVRKAILTSFVNTDTENIYAKMLEDTIILYFNRIFRQTEIISFSSAKGNKNPDFIIETLPKPIILEVGINKNTTKQISKSRIKYKYGIVINSKTDKIELQNDIVIIPMKYFLLL